MTLQLRVSLTTMLGVAEAATASFPDQPILQLILKDLHNLVSEWEESPEEKASSPTESLQAVVEQSWFAGLVSMVVSLWHGMDRPSPEQLEHKELKKKLTEQLDSLTRDQICKRMSEIKEAWWRNRMVTAWREEEVAFLSKPPFQLQSLGGSG